ncbi:Predicted membrane protein [Lachnospiraceae bacterium YSD2013]|nr:Predicted membrane protein [Lachnospiraceae bacterium YSD2013]
MKRNYIEKNKKFSLFFQGTALTRLSVLGAILLLVIIILLLVGCEKTGKADYANVLFEEQPLVITGNKQREVNPQSGGSETEEATVDKGGNLVIEKSLLSQTPLYCNYRTSGDTLMQVILVLAPNGSLRVGLNTSEECKGEPDAYFIRGDGILKCVHCGHIVANAEVGMGTNTSAPIGIPFSEEADSVIIKESDLSAYESYFTDWEGPIE